MSKHKKCSTETKKTQSGLPLRVSARCGADVYKRQKQNGIAHNAPNGVDGIPGNCHALAQHGINCHADEDEKALKAQRKQAFQVVLPLSLIHNYGTMFLKEERKRVNQCLKTKHSKNWILNVNTSRIYNV